MDERIETFLHFVLTSEGAPRVGEDVRTWLASYERVFPEVRRASYCERVIEEIARQKGTPTEAHLHIVLAAIASGASSFPSNEK
jgi:hypothetical protein